VPAAGSEFVGDLTTSLRISLTSRPPDSLSVERQTTVFVPPEAKTAVCGGDDNKSAKERVAALLIIVQMINPAFSVVCCRVRQ